jgi:hypothetical protein
MDYLGILGRSLGAVLLSAPAFGQYAERPSLPGSGAKAVDISGRSVKNKRVRAIHSTNPADLGGTAYFIQRDPFLAYQLGRNLNFREFRSRDGVFNEGVSGLGGVNPDGQSSKITARNQVSCVGCHNLPAGNPGGGANFSKDSGMGRNSPHYYGAGIVEMLALQVRADILRIADTNSDGWINVAESQVAPNPVQCETVLGSGDLISYGRLALSGGTTGTPQLNNIFRYWYVDASGKEVVGAYEVDGVTTVGFNFEMVVWGWGQGRGRTALNPTNRAFLWDPWTAHGGLDAHDPSTDLDPNQDGISEPTLSGAIQFPATHKAPDRGFTTHANGFSLDDPDGDGYMTEISEGDLDLAEWFMLNAPRPAFRGRGQEYINGVGAMRELGCTSCHTPSWTIRAQDAHFDGDRRLFDLLVRNNSATNRLEGSLIHLYNESGGTYTPKRGEFQVRGFFSDLRHHNMGEGFQEIDFGGTVNRVWRTPMLWGVGSGFPWGHDGQSMTLEDAILRHGGEAQSSHDLWVQASDQKRSQVLTLLRGMQLYDIESMPADIDGDGAIAANFMVAGMDTGPERFNAEWLFQTPVKIQGPFTNITGQIVRSDSATNVDAAYGQNLALRLDSDDDGWPDVWDIAPFTTGYKNGLNN